MNGKLELLCLEVFSLEEKGDRIQSSVKGIEGRMNFEVVDNNGGFRGTTNPHKISLAALFFPISAKATFGLANKKTVTIQPADKEQGVVLRTTKTKKQNKLKLFVNKFVVKKEFSTETADKD
ncbi:unnamed protein product [Microthlaspi erraticum]|uniref:Uncharacterized protein n=1 Tax=Microthlaspi erraticum TaxID=1685480 RepID=A0A6D2LBM0_9BRAS|nr:unnamed protein product [Microthlaspi erraticum]CAA7057042.1 unnamed protein product [Microthlaspi erraticum]